MYGWFFLLWFILFIFSFGHYVPGAQPAASLIGWGLSILFAAYANSLYHVKIKKKICAARLIARNENQLLEILKSGSGVQGWVVWMAGVIPVLGIVAAIAIPAMQKHSENYQNEANQYAKEKNVSSVVGPDVTRSTQSMPIDSKKSDVLWKSIGPSEIGDSYLDPASIQRLGRFATTVELLSLYKPQLLEDGRAYLSLLANVKYDCIGRTYKLKHVKFFEEKMGRGLLVSSYVFEDKDKSNTPMIPKDVLIDAVCTQASDSPTYWKKFKGKFKVRDAINAGATYTNIVDHLEKTNPEISNLRKQGYSDKEIALPFE